MYKLGIGILIVLAFISLQYIAYSASPCSSFNRTPNECNTEIMAR